MNTCVDQMSLVNRIKQIRRLVFQLVIQRIQKCMLLILVYQKINMFNMTRILVFLVVWILICLLQIYMLNKVLLCLYFHHRYHVTMLVLWIESILPVIFKHIVWETMDNNGAVTSFLSIIIKGRFIYSIISVTISY